MGAKVMDPQIRVWLEIDAHEIDDKVDDLATWADEVGSPEDLVARLKILAQASSDVLMYLKEMGGDRDRGCSVA
jgi:hypothetical protein